MNKDVVVLNDEGLPGRHVERVDGAQEECERKDVVDLHCATGGRSQFTHNVRIRQTPSTVYYRCWASGCPLDCC